MIPKDCKRLAEVDFPIARVSKHAAREKSIRHGHPSTLHLWWARRPLASCRAVLLALLWPDPCDPLCPTEFKNKARELLRKVGECNPGKTDEDLRGALLRFIAHFSNWDLAGDPVWLEVARGLVRAAYPEELPLVVDPFAGGGSIPLRGLAGGMRRIRERSQPGCLPDPQGHARGHSTTRTRAGRQVAPRGRGDQETGGEGAPRPLPEGSGRRDADCLPVGTNRPAASLRTVGRRSPWHARSGSARKRTGSARCATTWSGRRGGRRGSSSRSSSPRAKGQFRPGR
ncbi:MAG: hypothetical protein KatS3mg076_0989 [Candidatus Binatia bacterium]|nr:MAG: hypothetical protein KatS3mg076_0989 [Candidatus Binatia bacterium]